MNFEYQLHVKPEGRECTVRRDSALTERMVIDSPLGSLVVDQIDAHPENGAPGRAACHPFTPVHST